MPVCGVYAQFLDPMSLYNLYILSEHSLQLPELTYQFRQLKGEQTQSWPTASQINSSFVGRVQTKGSPVPLQTFPIWRSSLEGEENSTCE